MFLSSQRPARHVHVQHRIPGRLHRLNVSSRAILAVASIMVAMVAGIALPARAQETAAPQVPTIVTTG
jgi:hypothetical protein